MHHEEIQCAIRKTGITSALLARHLQVTPQVVSKVVHGKAKSKRVAQAIAKLTGLTLAEMWPGLYDEPPRPSVAALLGEAITPRRRQSQKA